MILVDLFKGFCIALFHLARGVCHKGGRKLRLSLGAIVLAVLAALLMKRVHEAFSERPPAWLRQEECSSPSLPKAAWGQFQQMWEQAQRYAQQRGVPLSSVRLWEVQNDLTNAVVWTTDAFVNPGFRSLSHMERSFPLGPEQFVGYYAEDGTPLRYLLKHTPTRPKELLMTVQLSAPLAPGAAAMVFRLERHFDRVKHGKDGKFQLGLGRMPGSLPDIYSWGVCLPENARFLRCVPEQGATILTNEIVQVSWLSAALSTSAPPISLVFTGSK